MEACEDLRPLLEGLKECKLPVALQAFASNADAFPSRWAPLSLVCPLTEFSAEFQAIQYALKNPTTELVFVDRSVDHVFQWLPQEDDALDELIPEAPEEDEAAMHGSAIGVEIGRLVPSFGDFHDLLLKNARVAHFSEWWDQYVDEAVIDADYDSYRQVMFMIGSLFRRLGTRKRERESDEQRERFMWTRMKEHLEAHRIDPADALYVCGAAHSASRVEEFGIASPVRWAIPERTATHWRYGLLPSSHSAIEHQFGQPGGAITLAEARWKKSKARKPSSQATLATVMKEPPHPLPADAEELVASCARIVTLARKHGYLATTADSIAVYQTSILLANMRNRRHPTPYDFRDAAVTCIEKDRVPGKRSIERLCDMLLGGDRIGKIGYSSLPPLARDVLDRLAVLPIKLEARTIQRALLDFKQHPEYLPASDLLWKLRYLLPSEVVRPIMGQRTLGHTAQQESWDVALGKYQSAVITLGYEGVTVEYVLERRLKQRAFGDAARTAAALEAAEDSLLFLGSERLTEELGDRATELMVLEPDVSQAQQIYARVTRLVHYYRAQPTGLPPWCRRFVTTGYSHYATLLPQAFSDRGVKPEDLTAMLQFILTLESLALSLGSERSQLVIALKQSAPDDPPKRALLWSAECVVGLRQLPSLREFFGGLLNNELTLPSLPEFLNGFLLALSFTPLVAGLTVELLSKAFERVPDRVLMPWLPQLMMMLRPHAHEAVPALLKEAAASFPRALQDGWVPPWEQIPSSRPQRREAPATSSRRLLEAYPATLAALCPGEWTPTQAAEVPAAADSPAARLLAAYPATLEALTREGMRSRIPEP